MGCLVRTGAAAVCVAAILGPASLPAFPQIPTSPQTLEVAATSEIRLAAPGAERAEALDPSIADVRVVSPGILSIRGVQPGMTAVLIFTAHGLLNWQVRVTSLPVLAPSFVTGQTGWVGFSYAPAPSLTASDMLAGTNIPPAACNANATSNLSSLFTSCATFSPPSAGVWGLSFKSGEWNVGADPSAWHMNLSSHDVTIAGASYLQTPLDQFSGVTDVGVSARTKEGLEVIGTPAGAQAYQHLMIPPADLFAGITPWGSLVGAQATFGALSSSAFVLDTAGQLQTAAVLSLQMGNLGLYYAGGPLGSTLGSHLGLAPFDIGLSNDSSGLLATVAYDLGNGRTLQAGWSGSNGFQVAFMVSFGAGPPAVELGSCGKPDCQSDFASF